MYCYILSFTFVIPDDEWSICSNARIKLKFLIDPDTVKDEYIK